MFSSECSHDNPDLYRRCPIGAVLCFSKYSLASEHSVGCNTLPAAVRQEFKLVPEGASIRGCVQDISKGRTTYELETVKNGYSKDITFDPDGMSLKSKSR